MPTQLRHSVFFICQLWPARTGFNISTTISHVRGGWSSSRYQYNVILITQFTSVKQQTRQTLTLTKYYQLVNFIRSFNISLMFQSIFTHHLRAEWHRFVVLYFNENTQCLLDSSMRSIVKEFTRKEIHSYLVSSGKPTVACFTRNLQGVGAAT